MNLSRKIRVVKPRNERAVQFVSPLARQERGIDLEVWRVSVGTAFLLSIYPTQSIEVAAHIPHDEFEFQTASRQPI